MTSSSGSRLVGAGSAYAVATVAPILTTLLLTPLITRQLGPEQYGYVALFLTCNQLGQVMAGLGLPAAIARRVGANPKEVGLSLGGVWVLAAVLAPLILISATVGVFQVDEPAVVVGVSAVMGSSFLALFTCAQAVSRGLEEIRVFVVQSVLLSIGGPIAGLLIAVAGGGYGGFLGGILGVQAVCGGRALFRLSRRHPPQFDRRVITSDVFLGLPAVPHQFATVGATALLVLLSGREGGPLAAGEMQVAILFGTAVLLVIGALNNSWAIQFYALPREDRGAFLSSTTRLLSAIAATGAVGTALAAPLGVSWLADPEMNQLEMATAATVAACAGPLMVLYLANIHVVFATGRTILLAIFTPATLLVVVGGVAVARTETSSLAVAACGVPLFYAGQAAWATVARRRLGLRDVSLLTSYGLSAVTVVICGIVALTTPPTDLRVAGAAVTALLGASFVAVTLRRESLA